MGLAGCETPAQPDVPGGYRVLDTLRIDENLVNILVDSGSAGGEDAVAQFAECAAVGYALEQGFGFARHIRTNRAKSGGTWRADAVYSITPTLPQGIRTGDGNVGAQNCADLGIPTG